MMDQKFCVVGISHLNTPIFLREKLAFQEATTKDFYKKLKEVLGVNEALLISTCNRTEVYYSSEKNLDTDVIKLLCVQKGIDSAEVLPFVRSIGEQKTVEYLFRVSLGLESKVLGDIQIINQVKRAYQWSSDEGMAGPFLHRLLHTIFFANKRVVQETSFRDGTGSVASVAVSLIETVANMVKDPKILLIGTGEIGQNVLENLEGAYSDITLINRNKERAQALAEANGYRLSDYELLIEEVNAADVVISAVASEHPIIDKEHLSPSLTQKLFIDLSVPRSISERVELVPGVMLYNIDQIEEQTSAVLKVREEAIANVEQIVSETLSDFLNWSQEMMVSPTIKLLKEKLEQIRQEELARYVNKIPQHEYDQMEMVTKNMLQKVIKLPILELKAACKRGDVDNLVDALHDIFNLERTVANKP
jgi:glutamyl-tRNA reductase